MGVLPIWLLVLCGDINIDSVNIGATNGFAEFCDVRRADL